MKVQERGHHQLVWMRTSMEVGEISVEKNENTINRPGYSLRQGVPFRMAAAWNRLHQPVLPLHRPSHTLAPAPDVSVACVSEVETGGDKPHHPPALTAKVTEKSTVFYI